MTHRPNPVVQFTCLFLLWVFCIASVVGIPFAAVITICWFSWVHTQRKRENAFIRAELEQRNMLEIGRILGG